LGWSIAALVPLASIQAIIGFVLERWFHRWGDDHTRECLTLVADASLSGRPNTIVSDNSAEPTGMAILTRRQKATISSGTTSLWASRCKMVRGNLGLCATLKEYRVSGRRVATTGEQ
jgi:hypothetical protein